MLVLFVWFTNALRKASDQDSEIAIDDPAFRDWGFYNTSWYLPKEQRFLTDEGKHEIACEGGSKNYELVGGWPVCHSNARRADKKCVVYSFGLGGDMEYEQFRAVRSGCEVHGFDPTTELKGIHEGLVTSGRYQNVTFHFLGATGERPHEHNIQRMGKASDFGSKTVRHTYGAVDPAVLKSLPEIMKSLGHDHIDILKFDCEGCEWGVFMDLSPEFLKDKVDDVLVETHFCEETMVPTKEAYQTLFKKILATHKLQGRSDNRQTSPTSPELLEMGVPENTCCMEFAFIKTDEPGVPVLATLSMAEAMAEAY